MELSPLPFDTSLSLYRGQAGQLLDAFRARDTDAVNLFRHNHPRFLNERVPWLPKRLSDDEILAAPLTLADAELALARYYDFADWPALERYVAAVHTDPAVRRFESGVEAVISGDKTQLSHLLTLHPDLIHARSQRTTKFDPPRHAATLLHYIAANGVEGYRQKTPLNAVEIARTLLVAGATPDALAYMYGGETTTLPMLVSSSHPAAAGLQVPLIDTLVDFGATLEPLGKGNWTSPLMTALIFGFTDAAEALVRRGARVYTLPAAAGLGYLEQSRELLPVASSAERHTALAIAAQLGRTEIVRLLLDAGEDPDRFNPEGHHSHATPLHHAALAGHVDVVRLFIERGARLDIHDKLWDSTPRGWALHNNQTAAADLLRAAEASQNPKSSV